MCVPPPHVWRPRLREKDGQPCKSCTRTYVNNTNPSRVRKLSMLSLMRMPAPPPPPSLGEGFVSFMVLPLFFSPTRPPLPQHRDHRCQADPARATTPTCPPM